MIKKYRSPSNSDIKMHFSCQGFLFLINIIKTFGYIFCSCHIETSLSIWRHCVIIGINTCALPRSPGHYRAHLGTTALTCVLQHTPAYYSAHLCTTALTRALQHTPAYYSAHLGTTALTCVLQHTPAYYSAHLRNTALTCSLQRTPAHYRARTLPIARVIDERGECGAINTREIMRE